MEQSGSLRSSSCEMKLLNIHTIRFLLIFVISHPAIFSKGEQCSASLPTVRVVQTCPQNEAELSHAQQQKKCEHLAKYQKCTKPATFKYHCVLNAFSNETIEVCAQEIYSQGYCVKFDEGSLLQMFGEDCTTYSNPCATRFLSSDLLQYLQCNDLLQKGRDSIRTTATPNHHNDPTRITTTPNPQNETNIGEILGMIFGFLGALVTMALVCVVFIVVKLCQSFKKNQRRNIHEKVMVCDKIHSQLERLERRTLMCDDDRITVTAIRENTMDPQMTYPKTKTGIPDEYLEGLPELLREIDGSLTHLSY